MSIFTSCPPNPVSPFNHASVRQNIKKNNQQFLEISTDLNPPSILISLAEHADYVFVRGEAYKFQEMQSFLVSRNNTLMGQDFRARDISAIFYDTSEPCRGYEFKLPKDRCTVPSPWNNTALTATPCVPLSALTGFGPRPKGKLSFLWGDLADKRREVADLVIYDGNSKFLTLMCF